MKFTFEANMYKGECYRCPMAQDCSVAPIVAECPLKEANEIVWHPYPKERPKNNPNVFYVCTLANAFAKLVVPSKYVDGKFHPLAVLYDDSHVIAWAEMPKPY